jgi:hypothetical protein
MAALSSDVLLGVSDGGLFGRRLKLAQTLWDAGKLFAGRKHARLLVYADGFKIGCPTGSRVMLTLNEVADRAQRAGSMPGRAKQSGMGY